MARQSGLQTSARGTQPAQGRRLCASASRELLQRAQRRHLSGGDRSPTRHTRTVTSLLLSGSFARFRDIKWLFSHAGGTIPMMAGRINSFYGARTNLKEFAPEGIEGELRRLHYDTANATFAPSMAALMKLVPISQIIYGTDYPYFGFGQVADLQKLGLSAGDLDAIGHENATRLIPRLK